MSEPTPGDPRLDQAGATDESILAAHEKLLGKKPDDKAHYRLLPLALLFLFSGIIFYAGTYLNLYSGSYSPAVFDEHGRPAAAGAAPAKADPLVLGKKNYELVCTTCHMANGLGVPGVYPPLAGSEWAAGSGERVIRIVLHGLKGPVHVKGADFGTAAMPSFGKVAGSGYNWSDEKIAAVLSYVRQEWGNKAAPVTAEQVTAIRTKEGDRKEWSQDELLKLP
jgi:mono/diheme cytochrome c family protein